MRPVGVAEVQPAIDVARLQREAHRAWIAVQDAERRESSAIEDAARKRVELGAVLIEARKAWPARGPKAKGWSEFLGDIGIEASTAWRYMQLAGYVEDVSCTVQETPPRVPTYTEAGIKRAAPLALTRYEDEPPAPQPRLNWMAQLEERLVSMERHAKALFSDAQHIDAICAEHEASVGSPKLMTMRSMLTGVKAAIADTLRLMEKK